MAWRRIHGEGLLGVFLTLPLFCLGLYASPVQQAVEYRLVTSGAELLAALASAEVEWIGLAEDIYLTEADMRHYELPFVLPANMTLTIASGDGTPKVLDLGRVLQLLWLETDSVLHLSKLKVQDGASLREGEAAGLPTIQTGWAPFSPTIDGADGHELTLSDVLVVRRRSGCSPQLVKTIATAFATILPSDSPPTADGLFFLAPGNATVPVILVNTTTGAEVGRADYVYSNFTASCVNETAGQPPPAAGAPQIPATYPSPNATTVSGAGSGSGSKTLTYAVIGSVVGVAAVAAAMGAALLLRKRRRALDTRAAAAGSSHDPPEAHLMRPVSDSALVVLEAGEGTPPPSEQGSTTQQGSGGGSTMGAGVEGGGLLSPATIWTTRVGPIKGLELGDLLGRGCYGRVYRGRWRGSIVAVKVIEQHFKGGEASRLKREPLLSVSLSHPAIVTTYKLAVVCVKPDNVPDNVLGDDQGRNHNTSGSGLAELRNAQSSQETNTLSTHHSSGSKGGSCDMGASGDMQQVPAATSGLSIASGTKSLSAAATGAGEVLWLQDGMPPGLYETVLVMEYCDRGSLTTSMMGGRFLNPTTHELDMVPALLTLIEIAQGMEYIHDLNLVHGDIKGRNVLLKSARLDRRGFQAKLADFGLSRILGHEQTHYDTTSFGTPSHAAPELLTEGKASKASDVYAFGMIVWEMVSGEEAHADLSTFQLIAAMSRSPDFRPGIRPSCPLPLADLIQRCWHINPQARPSSGEIVEELRKLLQEAQRLGSARSGRAPAAATPPFDLSPAVYH